MSECMYCDELLDIGLAFKIYTLQKKKKKMNKNTNTMKRSLLAEFKFISELYQGDFFFNCHLSIGFDLVISSQKPELNVLIFFSSSLPF